MSDGREIWEVVPYQSIGPVHFGMSMQEVAVLLGEPVWVGEDDGEVEARYRDESVVVTFEEGRVGEVGLTPSDLFLPKVAGIRPFDDDRVTVLQALETANGPVSEAYGFLIFDKLGFTLTGIHDGDRAQTALCAVSKETLAAFDVETKPISFKNLN